MQKSADKGYIPAIAYLSDYLYHGVGCEMDKERAFELAKQASDADNSFGNLMLGMMCIDSLVTDLGSAKGLELLNKAAKEGEMIAYHFLGNYYKDYLDSENAAAMYKIAAENGIQSSADSLYSLGLNTVYIPDDLKTPSELTKWSYQTKPGPSYGDIAHMGLLSSENMTIGSDGKKVPMVIQLGAVEGFGYTHVIIGHSERLKPISKMTVTIDGRKYDFNGELNSSGTQFYITDTITPLLQSAKTMETTTQFDNGQVATFRFNLADLNWPW